MYWASYTDHWCRLKALTVSKGEKERSRAAMEEEGAMPLCMRDLVARHFLRTLWGIMRRIEGMARGKDTEMNLRGIESDREKAKGKDFFIFGGDAARGFGADPIGTLSWWLGPG
jgi:hypothetical protein